MHQKPCCLCSYTKGSSHLGKQAKVFIQLHCLNSECVHTQEHIDKYIDIRGDARERVSGRLAYIAHKDTHKAGYLFY